MALMKAMSSTESSTMSPSDGGFYKMKQKIKSNKNQRKIKRAMEEKEKSNANKLPSDKTDKIPSNLSSNRPSSGSSNIEETANKYANPVKYKFQQFKENVQEKFQDVVAQAKQNAMERRNKREGASGEGGFSVCGPGGCKEGNYSEGRDKAASKPAWMGKN